MTSPLVSIIVPVYNTDKYLNDCLDSILQQTYYNIEIVCIDDGSTDNSPKILERYKDAHKQVKVITTINQGQAAARNLGIKASSGDFIMFIDSDDWLDPVALETVMNTKFFDCEDVDIVCFGIRQVINDDKTPFRTYSNNEAHPINEKWALNIFPEPVAKLYRSSFLRQNRITFPEGLWYEDITFHWVCLSCAKTVATIPDVFYNYRKRNDSTMGMSNEKTPGMAIHFLYNMEVLYNTWLENQYLPKHRALFDYVFELYTQQAYKFLSDKDRNTFINELKALITRINLKPKRFSLVFDLVNGNRYFAAKYRWARSIRKRILTVDNRS